MTEEIRAAGVSYTPPMVDPAPSPTLTKKKRGRPAKNKAAAPTPPPTPAAPVSESPQENKVLLDDDNDGDDFAPEQVFTPRPNPFTSPRLPGAPLATSPQHMRQ